MKRFLIFGFLGPPLGFVTAFWVLLQLLNWALGSSFWPATGMENL